MEETRERVKYECGESQGRGKRTDEVRRKEEMERDG